MSAFDELKQLAAQPAIRPTPQQVAKIRGAAHLTQEQAAALLSASLRGYQQWEAGERRMPPALFEYYCLLCTNPRVRAAARWLKRKQRARSGPCPDEAPPQEGGNGLGR